MFTKTSTILVCCIPSTGTTCIIWRNNYGMKNTNKNRIATALGIRTSTKIINPGSPVDGSIDEFRIYTKALTSNEVSSLYNNPGDLLPGGCNSLSINDHENGDENKIQPV